MLLNRSAPDVRQKRQDWKEHLAENDKNNLVFLYESGVNINMTGHYTRAKNFFQHSEQAARQIVSKF